MGISEPFLAGWSLYPLFPVWQVGYSLSTTKPLGSSGRSPTPATLQPKSRQESSPVRYHRALLPTLKEAPSDASNKSHVLLTRAGYIRRVGAGIYSFLPLGVRVLRKIERIIREEMDRAGAQEVLLPALLPSEYFRETGRWDLFGDTLLRL